MTEYLVVHKTAKYSGISIEPAGKVYDHPTECWAIRSGKQFLFARMKLPNLLDKFYFGGTYEKMAHYIISYQEMCAIVSDHMGPSDRKRYEMALAAAEGRKTVDWVAVAPALIQGTLSTITLILARGFRLLSVVILLPIALHWLNKRK